MEKRFLIYEKGFEAVTQSSIAEKLDGIEIDTRFQNKICKIIQTLDKRVRKEIDVEDLDLIIELDTAKSQFARFSSGLGRSILLVCKCLDKWTFEQVISILKGTLTQWNDSQTDEILYMIKKRNGDFLRNVKFIFEAGDDFKRSVTIQTGNFENIWVHSDKERIPNDVTYILDYAEFIDLKSKEEVHREVAKEINNIPAFCENAFEIKINHGLKENGVIIITNKCPLYRLFTIRNADGSISMTCDNDTVGYLIWIRKYCREISLTSALVAAVSFLMKYLFFRKPNKAFFEDLMSFIEIIEKIITKLKNMFWKKNDAKL